MKVESAIIIVLLAGLVALEARSEWRASQAAAKAAAAPEQPEFSVTTTGGQGQYVMRASDKIFFCVNNQCTGIQLVPTPAQAPAATPRTQPPVEQPDS
jgi:hypothetical protein